MTFRAVFRILFVFIAAFFSFTCNAVLEKSDRTIRFEGIHQAGIETPSPQFGLVAAFDWSGKNPQDLKSLFVQWTSAARKLSQGERVDTPTSSDSGEVSDYSPSNVTMTFGIGPSAFDSRLGLRTRKPAALQKLPEFPTDSLQEQWSDGDFVVQVCAEDYVSAYHALHSLTRVAKDWVTPRWVQSGFQPGRSVNPVGEGRNLQGFRDGTVNPNAGDPVEMESVVWVSPSEGPSWLVRGTYLVVRRIRMFVENWDAISVADQERVVGRRKAGGELVEPSSDDSHVQAIKTGGSEKIFRRPFSYFHGLDPDTKEWDSGLLFLSWQKDPYKQFVPIQNRLAEHDSLNEYTVAIGSAVFAVFPGVEGTGYLGQKLIESN